MPSMTALIVAVFPAPSALTVMVGVPPARVKMLPAVPLLSRIQLPAVAVAVSPKVRLPMVWAELRWTVLSVVISIVLKSAVKPEPLATVPPDQFVVVSQRPPEASWVQVPLVAEATEAITANSTISIARTGSLWIFGFVGLSKRFMG